MNTNPPPEPALLDDFDDEVLRAIAELHGSLDPVPAGLTEQITFALSVQALHAEVAEIVRTAEPAGVRSDYATAQTLTFSAESLSVMVTLTPDSGGTVRIDGWVTGAPGAVTIEVLTSAGSASTTSDSDGRFVIASHPHGLVRFAFQPAGAGHRPVMTPLVEI